MSEFGTLLPEAEFVDLEFSNKLSKHFNKHFLSKDFSPLKNIILYPFEIVSSTMDVFRLISNWEDNQIFIKENGLLIGEDLNLEANSCLSIILAKKQILGRGQKEKIWESPRDYGLYLSFVLHLENRALNISGFSLAIGLAVLKTANKFGLEAKLKWPNDVLVWNSKRESFDKLAGVLIESVSSGNNQSICIGIGLNLFHSRELDKVSGAALFQGEFSEELYFNALSDLTIEVSKICNDFLNHGFAGTKEEWLSNSMLIDKRVVIKQDTRELDCQIKSVNEHGALVVEFQNGKIEEIYNGEVIF
jgi:BirA family biotin operon repressor/biotin-[acetyl-CoA-carboxylase] ligase